MSSSELKVAEKWDTALEKGIKRMAYGAIAGGVVAALMFRGVGIRSMIIGVGTGTGIGITYAEAKRDFEELATQSAPAKAEI
ncbi:hypothetical protein BWQ96_06176 [Gracilariopsis chorda]|uniref:MICOS complex subunit MIC10 n=1 Tax=Gracilariopsis chorda TaxID=448386 RepID=A0A2V3IPT4_9FLOR|nr:hypothetical protein BWQ96_06176 [Gracilariopsis chorda]|eukprot:PXF44095.1 hypothetical protein BWQ96_06176 [Gracilariopsis chorda]